MFWIGVLVRVALLPMGGAGVASQLFVPFLNRAAEHIFANPWSLGGTPSEFPYGFALYFLHVLPFKLFHLVTSTAPVGTIAVVLLKLPLLGFDFLLFQNLKLLFPKEQFRLLALYWFNPVLLYISFFHGQLDLVPMALFLVGLRLLTRERILAASLCCCASLASKFHVAALFPFIAAWIWNNDLPRVALKKLSIFFLTGVAAIGLGYFLPSTAGQGSYNTFGSPEAHRLLAASIELSPGINLYLGIIFVLLLIARVCFSERITRDGLFVGSAVIMLSLLLATNPMPGWFFWCYPLIAVFFVGFPYAPIIAFIGHWCVFFVHFLVIPHIGGMLGADAAKILPGLSLTLLQAASLALLVLIWVFAAKTHLPLGIRLRPFAIGIAGDSGAGKNRLTESILQLFNQREFLHVEGDDYHKWERGHSSWGSYTHLHPKANHLPSMASNTSALLGGRAVFQSHYDHSTGRFTKPLRQSPKKVVVVQGLHTFFLRAMRKEFDLRVFLAPHYLIRLGWKIDRDVTQRGHSLEKVLTTMRKRELDSQRYILAQTSFADCVIEYLPLQDVQEQEIIDGKRVPFAVRYNLWNDSLSHVEALTELLRAEGLDAELSIAESELEKMTLTVRSFPDLGKVHGIAARLFPNPRLITRTRTTPSWRDGIDGLHQLVILALLASQRQYGTTGRA